MEMGILIFNKSGRKKHCWFYHKKYFLLTLLGLKIYFYHRKTTIISDLIKNNACINSSKYQRPPIKCCSCNLRACNSTINQRWFNTVQYRFKSNSSLLRVEGNFGHTSYIHNVIFKVQKFPTLLSVHALCLRIARLLT